MPARIDALPLEQVISVRVDEVTQQELAEVVELNGTSEATEVRKAVRAHIRREKRKHSKAEKRGAS